jgi:hypothetical protein
VVAAETALCSAQAVERGKREALARLLRKSAAMIRAEPMDEKKEGTLTVCLHHMVNRSHGATVRHLCDSLNETMTIFPGTSLRLIYEIRSEKIPEFSHFLRSYSAAS